MAVACSYNAARAHLPFVTDRHRITDGQFCRINIGYDTLQSNVRQKP